MANFKQAVKGTFLKARDERATALVPFGEIGRVTSDPRRNDQGRNFVHAQFGGRRVHITGDEIKRFACGFTRTLR